MYQFKDTGREKNIHLHGVFQRCFPGWETNPPTWEGTPEESALGKNPIPLKPRLGFCQASFCVYPLGGVGVFAGEVRMCEEWSWTICRALWKGNGVHTPSERMQ